MTSNRSCAVVLAGVLVLVARPAKAEPQGTAGLTLGIAGAGEKRELWDKTLFHLGARGDVLFGRSSTSDFGAGPYAEILTNGFDDFQFGGGLSVLLPIIDYLPVVLSTGGYGRAADEVASLEAGLAGELFWGTRSFNFHSNYVMSAGLMAQFRYGLGPSGETAIVLGVQVDVVAMSLPFAFVYNALRGPSADAAPIRQ